MISAHSPTISEGSRPGGGDVDAEEEEEEEDEDRIKAGGVFFCGGVGNPATGNGGEGFGGGRGGGVGDQDLCR